jgi:MFS family permease
MADVNTGIGPFLAIYLTATRHWNPASVGMVVAAQGISSVVAQGPAGWLVDWSQHKKRLIMSAAAVVALGCLGIVAAANETAEILTQILIGVAAALFPPTIAAISLGIVGKEKLSRRIGRNETFNHAGNVTFALMAGAAGTWLGWWLWGRLFRPTQFGRATSIIRRRALRMKKKPSLFANCCGSAAFGFLLVRFCCFTLPMRRCFRWWASWLS